MRVADGRDRVRAGLCGLREHVDEGGARIGYSHDGGKWEVALFGRNITDEENVKGAIDFNNLTGFDNEPRIIGASFRTRF